MVLSCALLGERRGRLNRSWTTLRGHGRRLGQEEEEESLCILCRSDAMCVGQEVTSTRKVRRDFSTISLLFAVGSEIEVVGRKAVSRNSTNGFSLSH